SATKASRSTPKGARSLCATPTVKRPRTPAASFTCGRATARRSWCRLARSPTPRRRRVSFPACRAGSAMRGASVRLDEPRYCADVEAVFDGSGAPAGRAGGAGGAWSDAMFRSWSRRGGGNRLNGTGRGRLNRRERGLAAAKMQPSLDILRPAGQAAEDSARWVRRRRDGRDRNRRGPSRLGLDGRGRRGARRALLFRVSGGDLHDGGLRPVVKNDLLRRVGQRVRVARVLVAGEDRILAAV